MFTNTPLKYGIAKSSDGTLNLGIPSTVFTSAGTATLSANVARYIPIWVQYPVQLNTWKFEVTAAPTGAANVAIGIYAANNNIQPVGAPLYDSGSISVANGFTGLKTRTGLSISLNQGIYLIAANVDNAMDLRSVISPSPIIDASISSSPIAKRYVFSLAFGAFPNPGLQWVQSNAITDVVGLQHVIFWQWTE